jgi:cytoskeletal protein CcmA (bactofilin family)
MAATSARSGPAAPSEPAATARPLPTEPPVVDRGTVRHERIRTDRWSVDGIAKVDREVEVGRADLRGTVVVGGSVSAGELLVRGSLEVRGAVSVLGRLVVRGSLGAAGVVGAGDASLDGTVRVAGELSAGSAIRADGTLFAGSLRAPSVRLRGTAAVPGTVETTGFDGVLTGDSSFGTIRSPRLRLKGPVENPVRWVLGRHASVVVERIEGEQLELEGVRASFARAREIVLGRDSHLLAYEGRIVRAHPTSRVGPESWTAPPAGLRR